ncbi:unnamed protein product [Schistosoma margrebowiei]|uniref:Uncharacterized protein n=1 Tax=Schistosoma margrebowiei TaxID=48269 RepID=A0A183LF46_9TREM|nr:unnamed protein product [Schistosoma margrebowiei]
MFCNPDLDYVYLQVEVAEDSRELLTINTHRGLFQYNRLAFGVKTAPSIFQQLMDTILSGIAGVATYLDDILIVATSLEQLRERTTTVLQRVSVPGRNRESYRACISHINSSGKKVQPNRERSSRPCIHCSQASSHNFRFEIWCSSPFCKQSPAMGFDFDTQYRRIQQFGQADALSRIISEHHTADEDEVIASLMTWDHAQCYLTTAVRALPVPAAEIQPISRNDSIIKRVMKYVTNGWPSTGLNGDLKQLYHRLDSLYVVNECLMFGDRVVAPESLRSRVLKQFHTGHPGVKRMNSIARSYAYLPLMDQHIVDLVGKCTVSAIG